LTSATMAATQTIANTCNQSNEERRPIN
jgi:hypothetical protein